MTTALILAGHGSHVSPKTAGLVWRHVDRLRAMGVADEVTAAFWKELPSYHSVIKSLSANDITIIPLFTAQGYFTRTVIPSEMGLIGPLTIFKGRTIRYARTLSEHPYLSQVVDRRVQQALHERSIAPEQTAIAIIGHSTQRMPESREATEAQAARLRDSGIAAEVVAIYLDDEPRIPDVYHLTSAPNLIAVPYFLASGSHTTLDVPGRMGLEPGQTSAEINGRNVIYTLPVGVEDDLTEVILQLAQEAGAPLRPLGTGGSAWDSFPAAGRDDLLAEVKRVGILKFGQLLLTEQAVYPRSANGLRQDIEVLDSPAMLRERIREAPFRPLATSTDLPTGWHIPIVRPEMLHATVETVYPGLVADWSAYRRGQLRIESLDSTLARQTGMFRRLGILSAAQRAEVVNKVCVKCACSPLWFNQNINPGTLPCSEVCNFWMSQALAPHSNDEDER